MAIWKKEVSDVIFNVSVSIKRKKNLEQGAEIKNMNSVSNVKKAIEFEINRQIELLEQEVVTRNKKLCAVLQVLRQYP